MAIDVVPLTTDDNASRKSKVPSGVAQQLAALQALQKQAADASQPIYHQGLGWAKVAAAGLGGLMEGITERKESAAQDEQNRMEAKYRGLNPGPSKPASRGLIDMLMGGSGMFGSGMSPQADATPPDAPAPPQGGPSVSPNMVAAMQPQGGQGGPSSGPSPMVAALNPDLGKPADPASYTPSVAPIEQGDIGSSAQDRMRAQASSVPLPQERPDMANAVGSPVPTPRGRPSPMVAALNPDLAKPDVAPMAPGDIPSGPQDRMRAQAIANPPAGSIFTPEYRTALRTHESGNNPNARSSTSSAEGLDQFTKPTWDELRRSRPDLALTADGRTNQQQSDRAIEAFTVRNANHLTDNGIQPTPGNLYMAHFMGAGGATSFLKGMEKNPDAPAYQMVSPEAARANQNIFFDKSGNPRTAQQVYALQTRDFQGTPGQDGARVQVASNDPNFAPGQPQGARPQPAGQQVAQATQQPTEHDQLAAQLIVSPRTSDAMRKQIYQEMSPAGKLAIQLQQQQLQKGQNELSRDPIVTAKLRGEVRSQDAAYTRDQSTLPLDVEQKRLANEKAKKDLEAEGFLPLTDQERKDNRIGENVIAYKNKNGDLKFGPVGTSITNNVDTKGETEQSKATGKIAGETLIEPVAAYAKNTEAARQKMNALNSMSAALQTPGLYTGALGDKKLAFSKTLDSIGSAFNIQPSDDIKNANSAGEMLEKFSRQLAGAQAKSLGGSRVTNFELDQYIKANPGILTTKDGNERLIGIMNQMAQREMDLGAHAEDYIASKGSKSNISEFRKSYIEDYDRLHPIRDPITNKPISTVSGDEKKSETAPTYTREQAAEELRLRGKL